MLRYRAKVAQQRVSEIARLGNVLRYAGIKIDSVASSIATKSGRAMIEALIDGERRGPVLAQLARGKMRAKIPDLAMALEGRFGDHHALMCLGLHLDHIDHLEAMLARLDARIEAMMTPFRAAGGSADHSSRASARRPRPRSSPRSAPTSASTFPTTPAWPPGPGCAPVITNKLESGAPASAAKATSTCSPSWSSAPGPQSATMATSSPSTTGT